LASLDQIAIGKMPDKLESEPKITPKALAAVLPLHYRVCGFAILDSHFRFKRNVQNSHVIALGGATCWQNRG
jgi:hypothetical protein